MDIQRINLERHKRHLLLKEIGGPGLARLRDASVSIVGAGALGGPCAMYLAAAGIGHIEIMDDDHVDLSNLQRQIQFTEDELGKPKASVLAARLHAQNSEIALSWSGTRFSLDTRLEGNILIDATDNYHTRYALNTLAHQSGRALVSGAAARWTGQVSVFASGVQSATPCYRCWVPEEPPEAEACDAVGVLGAITGLVGTRMALEVIKLVLGTGDSLVGKVWLVDGLSGDMRTVKLRPDPACPLCG